MNNDNCKKSADGEHEINFEKMVYRRHVGLHAALFDIECLHCGATGNITVEDDAASWDAGDPK